MFYNFFNAYKEKAFRGDFKSLKRSEKVMLGAPAIFLALFLLFSFLRCQMWIVSIPFFAIISCLIIILLYGRSQDKKRRTELLREYKDSKIEPLLELLKDKDYNLFSDEGIDWLIECCEQKLKKNAGANLMTSIRNFFITAIYPLITLIIGLAINTFDANQAVSTVIRFITMLIVLFGLWMVMKPTFTKIAFYDKWKYEYLREGLAYIKTQRNSADRA
ncbi:MAG: hypothetical protein FWE69_00885 [Clostridiales bacterium]|nr:hypothetical protein [Clostridiales bacterium]